MTFIIKKREEGTGTFSFVVSFGLLFGQIRHRMFHTIRKRTIHSLLWVFCENMKYLRHCLDCQWNPEDPEWTNETTKLKKAATFMYKHLLCVGGKASGNKRLRQETLTSLPSLPFSPWGPRGPSGPGAPGGPWSDLSGWEQRRPVSEWKPWAQLAIKPVIKTSYGNLQRPLLSNHSSTIVKHITLHRTLYILNTKMFAPSRSIWYLFVNVNLLKCMYLFTACRHVSNLVHCTLITTYKSLW